MDEHAPRWPPVIPRTRAPWPLRVRDALLTLIAWFLLLWVLRDALLSLVAGVSPEAAARTAAWLENRLSPMLGHLVPVAPAVFWRELDDFLYAALAFVAWLVMWGWLNREQLQRQPPALGAPHGDNVSPSPLATSEQFATNGAQPLASLWQQARRLRVQCDDFGRVLHVRVDDAPPR